MSGECKTCGGTGKIAEMRTWFTADGYRWTDCGICGGTGKSYFQPSPEYVRFQRDARRPKAAPEQEPSAG